MTKTDPLRQRDTDTHALALITNVSVYVFDISSRHAHKNVILLPDDDNDDDEDNADDVDDDDDDDDNIF